MLMLSVAFFLNLVDIFYSGQNRLTGTGFIFLYEKTKPNQKENILSTTSEGSGHQTVRNSDPRETSK